MDRKNRRGIQIIDDQPWETPYSDAVIQAFSRPLEGERAQVPSGLAQVTLYEGDHILVVSANEQPPSLYPTLKEFACAGLRNRAFTEACSFEVDDRLSKQEIIDDISESVPASALDRLDVTDWAESGEYFGQYTEGTGDRFTVADLESYFLAPTHRARHEVMQHSDALLRVVSQDSGRYLSCLANPDEYVRYERVLPKRLSSTTGCSVLQLCTYEMTDIARASARYKFFRRARFVALLVGLIRSHNVAFWIDKRDVWHLGMGAACRMLIAAFGMR